MKTRRDDPKLMAQMRQWLLQASELGEVDPRIITDLEPDLLKMASHTAHELSRPGTPLTAFIAGFVAARAASNCGPGDVQRATLTQSQVNAIVEAGRHYVNQVLAVGSLEGSNPGDS